MGFYGNIKNTSQIQFQFDRIFESRTAMDQAVTEGTDKIFNGRFVLVKYDPDGSYFIGNMPLGYLNPNDNKIYLDNAFTLPYIYMTFTHVDDPIETDWNNYYYFDGKFYLKLPSQDYYQANNQNYYTRNTGNSTALDSQYVGLNTLVRLRDSITGAQTESYYKCSGGTVGDSANWTMVLPDADFSKYMINFNKDKATYEEDFDPRGYDGTVWEKIYSEGLGRFILIARLNGGQFPQIELFPEAPSELPTAASIDALSSEAYYRIRVPSMYGFQPKPIDLDVTPNALTDQKAKTTVKRYNETTHEIESLQTTTDVAFYYNKAGGDKQYRSIDTTTANEILIEPTGESGKIYYDREGNQVTEDIMELTIHMPMVGNMVADGYDLIYGYNTPTGTGAQVTRPTDISWVDGSASDAQKLQGSGTAGGKSRDLATLAGTLNEMHNRLGQIIVHVTSLPAPEAAAKNLIYEYNNTFWRRGDGGTITLVTEDQYTYTLVDTSIAQTELNAGINNKYFSYTSNTIPANVVPTPATSYESGKYYFLRNIIGPAYEQITPPLIKYESQKYYRKIGSDYFRDNSTPLPTDASQIYYNIGSITERTFQAAYINDGSLYTLEDGIYIPATSNNPQINTIYYSPNEEEQYNGGQVLFYKPNTFFYKDPDTGSYILDKASTMTSARQYYVVTFDTSITTYAQVDGNSVAVHPMKEALGIGLNGGIDATLRTYPSGTTLYFLDENMRYVPYSALENMESTADRSLYTFPHTYYKIESPTTYTRLFIPDVYYEYNTSTGDYTLARTFINTTTKYYELSNIQALNQVFYLPKKYYYENGGHFEMDHDNIMTDDRIYYSRRHIYVDVDQLQECPHGMEWPESVEYIPPSISLYYRIDAPNLVEIKGINNGDSSINATVLNLHREFDFGNLETRDLTTFRGCFNTLNDTLYRLKEIIPGQILFVNEFGQVVSISLTELKQKLNNV